MRQCRECRFGFMQQFPPAINVRRKYCKYISRRINFCSWECVDIFFNKEHRDDYEVKLYEGETFYKF